MKKALIIYLVLALTVPFSVVAANNLFEFYDGKLPSLDERAITYSEAGFQDAYSGTLLQNTKLLNFLQNTLEPIFGSLAPPPSTVEGVSTAGWTDDGSIVRLNTISDFVGIGTINPPEKLSVYGGNTYLAGNVSVTGNVNISNGTGTSTLSVNSSGFLGVGTTSPTKTWSVHGNSWTTGTSTTGVLEVASSSTSLNKVIYVWPSTQGGANQVLQNNGSGTLTWVDAVSTPVHYSYATNTPINTTGGAVTSSFFTIPAGTMKASSTITVDAQISKCLSPGGAGAECIITVQNGSGTNFVSANVGSTATINTDTGYGTFRAVIFNNGSLSAQSGVATSFCVNPATDVNDGCAGGAVSSAIDTSGALTIQIRFSVGSGVVGILDRYSIRVDQ